MRENWRIYQNYIIIAILSLISVFFLPMLGTSLGIGFNIPNTTAGWIVWVLTKLCIVVVNILIFDQFVKQAKVNVKDNENFKKAEEILSDIKEEVEEIQPARIYISKLYKKKGISLCISTILSIFGLTNAILSFDWVSMLTYIFTITMALIFGWITMNEVEEIWIDKHYKYALKVQKEREEQRRINESKIKENMDMAQSQSNKQGDHCFYTVGGINILDTCLGTSIDSLNNTEQLVVDSNSIGNSILVGSIYTSNTSSNSINNGSQKNI